MENRLDVRNFVFKMFMIFLVTFMVVASLNFTPQIVEASDEYDSLRGKWKDTLTGGTSYDPNDPDIAARITQITSDAQNYWDTMNKSAGRTYLWEDLNSTTISSHIPSSYFRLFQMALAYSTVGSDLYGDTTLKSDIISGLDWMYTNRYNEMIIYPDEAYGNWYHWEISSPQHLNNITIIMYQDLSTTQINNYMNAIENFSPDPTINNYMAYPDGDRISTGSNRVNKCKVVAIRGVIVKDSAKIVSSRDALSDVFDYVTIADGFYTDGSFIQHGKVSYNGGYGINLLSNIAALLSFLSGSTWEVTDPDKANVYNWVYDSFEPLIYKGAMMDMVRGRYMSRRKSQDHVAGHKAIRAILTLTQGASESNAAAYKKMIKYWVESDTFKSIYSDSNIYIIVKIKEIMNDSGITPRGELIKNKIFSNMDRVVHLRSDFGFGISKYSGRIRNYESINGENLKGWYTGYGMTYLYNDDLGQFSDEYWATVNKYRLPGTTVDTRSRSDSSETKQVSSNNWVGGTTMNGLYGVSGMELADNGSALTAKKSWFMFDDEIMALGSGITSPEGLESAADAYVRGGIYADKNYGTQNILYVKDSGNADVNRKTYLKFDISDVPSVSAATLRVYGYNATDSTDVPVLAYGAESDSWSETGITWNNAPSRHSLEQSTVNINGMHQYYDFDVTTFVGNEVSGDKIVTLVLESVNDEGKLIKLNSRENNNGPRLVITTNDGKIYHPEGRTIETIVENRKINSIGDNALQVNGSTKSTSIGWSETMAGVDWIHLAGNVSGSDLGYYFPGLATIKGLRESRTDTWASINSYELATDTTEVTKNYLTLWMDHGSNPDHETYSYVLLPNKTESQVNSYASNPDVIILENSTSAQGVKETSLNTVGVNFFNDELKTVDIITSNKKASILTKENTDTYIDIAVSDPTMANTGTIEVELNRSASSVISIDPSITVTQLNPTIKFTVDVNNAKGKTFQARFNLEGLEPVADAYVRGGTYADTNYGTATKLHIKDSTNVDVSRKTFLKFDITSVSSVGAAKLRVYGNNAEDNSIVPVNAYGADSDSWTETGITWNNAPARHGAEQSTVSINGTPQYYDFNVTSFVQNELSGDKVVTLVLEDTSDMNKIIELNSKENTSNIPILIVTPVLNPIADAHVRGGIYADTNYGTTSNLSVKDSTFCKR